MLSGAARVAQRTDPRKCRPTFQGVAKWTKGAAVWENNPRIARPDEAGDFQELIARDANNLRPYHTGKTAERWTYNLAFRPYVGELYLTDAEREFGERFRDRVIIEPTIGPGASPNKQWPSARWLRFVQLAQVAGLKLTQLGAAPNRVLPGVEFVGTQTFRLACAVLAHARAYVGHEGGMHHAAAALGVPGVVLFGGFTPVELTGYPLHRNLGVSLGGACGMRVICRHCEAEMAKIAPEQVLDELETILGR
jgi:hypothetical protein